MKNKIVEIISDSIEDINESGNDITFNGIETELMGGKSALDSLGLVSLIIQIEQKIEDEYNVNIIIADEKAMSLRNSPFRTVSTLANYIEKLIEDVDNE